MSVLTSISKAIDPEYSKVLEENKQLKSDIKGYIDTMENLEKENEKLKSVINEIKAII